nr:WYL domain-containing protein [Kribbella italica]
MESLRLTRLQNYWEFPAPPIDSAALSVIGTAVRFRHLLLAEFLHPDGTRPDFAPVHRLEPHHLVVWAGRWYVVAYDLTVSRWRVHRIDRLHPRPTTTPFGPRVLPGEDLTEFVTSSHDRGDHAADWPCTGYAVLALPAQVVARWAPGGSVVDHLGPERCRLTLGAWSWAGVAGILATFDTPLTEVEPAALRTACHDLAQRYLSIS